MPNPSVPNEARKRKEAERERKVFNQGFAAAVADLIRAFDYPSVAINILKNSGVSMKDLRSSEIDSFDMKPIEKAAKDEQYE